MSFAADVKTELMSAAGLLDGQRPFLLAHCGGIAAFARYYDEMGIVVHTDGAVFARYAQQKFRQLGIEGKSYKRRKGGYEYSVKDPEQVKHLRSLIPPDGEGTGADMDKELYSATGATTFSYFLSGCFLAGGSVTSPDKEYLLEFSTSREQFARSFAALLTAKGFPAKITLRKSQYIIYFKASEQIEDLLTTMGATGASLSLMNSKIIKDIRNNANRITNCETANIDKTVSASERHLRALQYIEACGALHTLPPEIRETALLRRENPDISLTELGALCTPPVGKSGVNHRLKKMEDAAARLAEKEQNA